jgi:HAD superfamily hydrolase (TIGR01459 family)
MTIRAAAMKEFSQLYPVWFCDVWGVLHDGYSAFPEATRALALHRKNGGTVVLLTNSPRSAKGVAGQLTALGVMPDCYDAIVTSGDVTQDLLRQHAKGKVHHMGPARDLSILDGQAIARVPLAETKTVLVTGLFDDETETPADYADRLAEIKAHDAMMICANPDKIVRKGNRILFCAGALGEAYQAIGGEVLMAGKPFKPIYDLAMATATRVAGHAIDKTQVLAIGDGPETDIKGAADFGITAVLIADGITDAADGLDAVAARVTAAVPHARLVATLPALAWSAA